MSIDTAPPPAVAHARGSLVRAQGSGVVGVVLDTHPDLVDVMTEAGVRAVWTISELAAEAVPAVLGQNAIASVIADLTRTRAEQAAVGVALAEQQAMTQTAREEARVAQERVAEMEDRWVRFWSAANDFANSQGYCHVYDRFAEEWGAPPRPVDVDVSVEIEVSGTDANLDLWDAINPNGLYLTSTDSDISYSYTVTLTHTAEGVAIGQCACDVIDGDVVTQLLEDNSLCFDEFDYSVSCPND